MILAKQPFARGLRCPPGFGSRPTSELLESGVFSFFLEPGLPFYPPIGERVLERTSRLMKREAEALGIDLVTTPWLVRNEVLAKGQELAPTFESKLLHLDGALDSFHLITSPEMLLLEIARHGVQSHRQLPMRLASLIEFFRAEKRTAGLRKTRQIRAFVGVSLDADAASLAHSIELFERHSERVFDALRIPTVKFVDHHGATPRYYRGPPPSYYYYRCAEGDWLNLPGIDAVKRVRALAIGMVYHYDFDSRRSPRARGRDNRGHPLLVASSGMSLSRVLYCACDRARDALGFALPAAIRPFDVTLIPSRPADHAETRALYAHLRDGGLSVALDDRASLSIGVRAAFSDYVGTPHKVVVAGGAYSIRRRGETGHQKVQARDELIARLLREDVELTAAAE